MAQISSVGKNGPLDQRRNVLGWKFRTQDTAHAKARWGENTLGASPLDPHLEGMIPPKPPQALSFEEGQRRDFALQRLIRAAVIAGYLAFGADVHAGKPGDAASLAQVAQRGTLKKMEEPANVAPVDAPGAKASDETFVNASLLPPTGADAAEERLRLRVQCLRPPVRSRVTPFLSFRSVSPLLPLSVVCPFCERSRAPSLSACAQGNVPGGDGSNSAGPCCAVSPLTALLRTGPSDVSAHDVVSGSGSVGRPHGHPTAVGGRFQPSRLAGSRSRSTRLRSPNEEHGHRRVCAMA